MTITAETKKSVATFTIKEIDEQLENLVNILEHAEHADRKELLKSIDKWLDKRNRALGI